jgi:hypothetical protein
LDQFPNDLSATYKGIPARVPEYDGDMARDAIHWLSFTRRPAKHVELAEAVVQREEYTDMDGDRRLRQPRNILDICQGLLTYDETTAVVSLAHPSIRTFITSATQDKEAPPWYLIPVNLGDSYMTEKCLTYLMVYPFRAGFCTFQQPGSHHDHYPLLDYAVSQWALHAAAALVNDSSSTTNLELSRNTKRRAWRQLRIMAAVPGA